MKTNAVRLYGEKDLRLDEFELPEILDDEILVKIISDSVCMSTYKLVQQGNNHKRVSKDLAVNPAVIGHELSGIIMKAGKKWKDLYPIGMKFTVQPEVTIHGESRTVGYNYPMYGGDSTYSILPAEVMETNSLIPFHGDSFFEASLSEPASCIIAGYHRMYHTSKKNHEHIMGVKEDGNLKSVRIFGHTYKGKGLYEVLESYVRKGFYAMDSKEKERGKDIMWYIWLSENSPLFGKGKMATFERYFLAEKETHKEKKNPYYLLLEDEKVICHILKEFGLENKDAHIINGHVPVKCKDGEKPIKCDGKVLVIDGGFSRAYQKETGIAGYTLIYNSYGLILAAHEPFESTEAAIEKESDIHSDSTVVKRTLERKKVEDTDVGRDLKEQIADLEVLLAAYRSGVIAERL